MRKARASDEVPDFLQEHVPIYNHFTHDLSPAPSASRPLISEFLPIDWDVTKEQARRRWNSLVQLRPHHLLNLQLWLIIGWILVLQWGERATLQNHLKDCAWNKWERWSGAAQPFHLALITDPQLVDPHTYPGRRWPVSSLTEFYTDQYMRRAFWRIQTSFMVDGVILLGDLFDGGREWNTSNAGQAYWLSEYQRFDRIFTDQWLKYGRRKSLLHRIFMAGVPGNHDLGFGNGIKTNIRSRFQTYFGPGDRVDIIANHTFLSLDTVSLSAKNQMQESQSIQAIWEPTDQFLQQLPSLKKQAVERALAQHEELLDQSVVDLNDTGAQTMDALKFYLKNNDSSSNTILPSIILSHVPFFRDSGTPCGPLRERYPSQNLASEKDEKNAIHIGYGDQYQNVLTADISRHIVEHVGGDISHIFSGDDHDYCEIVHKEFPSQRSGIREITIKAFSWAMGVRRPGFLLVSLWNPLDGRGEQSTVQTHLCLLPDQLSIFIAYGQMLALTLILLFIDASTLSQRLKRTKLRRYLPRSYTYRSPTLPFTATDRRRSVIGRPRSQSEAYPYNKSTSSGALKRLRQNVLNIGGVAIIWYLWLIWRF